MPEVDQVAQLVRRLPAAFLSGDRAALEEILSEDFTFNSPRDNHISKTEYFERRFPHGDEFRTHRIEYIRTERLQVKAVDVFFGSAPDA